MVIEAEGFDLAAGTKPLLEDAELVLERGEHVALIGPNGSGKSTLLEGIVGRRGRPDRPRRRARVLLPARGRARRARQRARVHDGRHGPAAAAGAGAARPLPLLRLGRAREAGRPALGRRAPSARRSRSSSPPERTSSSSTSRRTISTSRAARRSRPRSRRFRAQSCSSPTTAQCSTPSPSGSSRSRTEVSARTPAAGPTTLASAPARTLRRRRSRRSARRSRGPRSRSRLAGASSSCVESSIQERELEIADLERRLAEDWGDADILAAHKVAREELQGLLERWEQLFESAQQV